MPKLNEETGGIPMTNATPHEILTALWNIAGAAGNITSFYAEEGYAKDKDIELLRTRVRQLSATQNAIHDRVHGKNRPTPRDET